MALVHQCTCISDRLFHPEKEFFFANPDCLILQQNILDWARISRQPLADDRIRFKPINGPGVIHRLSLDNVLHPLEKMHTAIDQNFRTLVQEMKAHQQFLTTNTSRAPELLTRGRPVGEHTRASSSSLVHSCAACATDGK